MAEQKKVEFLKSELPAKILSELGCAEDELLETELTTPEHLDGFMSTIHRLNLVTRNRKTSEKKSHSLMVKVMKGDDAFREGSLSEVQFSNEIYIYTKVLPCFKQLLLSSGSSIRGDCWCPRILYGAAGKFPAYSEQYETILVMENMTLNGFKAGPRNDLDEEHLILMARRIAQFHACSYALRIRNEELLKELVEGIIPLNFVQDEKHFDSYAALYKLGVARVVEYIDKHPKVLDSEKFKSDFNKFRSKHGDEPIHLMQKFLSRDEYSVILHGDYNRNNVLFKYENGKPVDLRMFDFQENRYGTPAIDLTFFMSMSMPTGLRERFWQPLLKHYHDSLLSTLMDILKCDSNDPGLEPYKYDHFMKHLTKFGLYGGMVAIHFLPWMLCPEEECAQLAFHFAKDMYSPELKHWTRICGGETVDKRLVEILRHHSQQGYFSIVDEN